MNYRHSYHAGNFADVFKHLILTLVLGKLRVKDTPFCVLDTHAGIGHYDLRLEEAQKTGEYLRGIAPLYEASLTALFQPYLKIVKAENFASPELRYYPGSPAISRALLREQDRLILAELHPDDAELLKQNFRGDGQVAVHHMNAYHAIKAFLPPKEKRGLVLIDPPFEKTDEFEQITRAIKLGYERFRQGIFAIWYPIKDRLPVQQFHNSLVALGIQKILVTELLIHRELLPDRLNGCGMVIINAPWQLDSELDMLLPELLPYVTENGSHRVEWLVGG
jgi:23S rRNA (adenine2030-N6)-methyltransferase